MISYFTRHMQVLFATLGDMARTPTASINTILIIAVTLLLPCLLYIGVQSASSMSEQWQGRPQFTIFFEKEINEGAAELIFEEVQLHPKIELAELLTAEDALAEFKLLAGRGGNSLDSELAFIGENPLPASIVVMPKLVFANTEDLQQLEQQLSQFDGIDKVRLDLAWTNRFNAMLAVFKRVAMLLSGLLALALILIVGNTIKLLIFNRRHEIEITKLVGGTDTFIRRPFLYYGTFFGILGGIITLILLIIARYLVADPIQLLAETYQSNAFVYTLSALESLAVIGIGAALGWIAARWSVAQHLRKIKPS